MTLKTMKAKMSMSLCPVCVCVCEPTEGEERKWVIEWTWVLESEIQDHWKWNISSFCHKAHAWH